MAKTVLYYQTGKIIVKQVQSGKKDAAVFKPDSFDLNDHTIIQTFDLIKKKYNSRFHILIAEEYSHLAIFPIPAKDDNPYLTISKKCHQLFSLDADTSIIKWKQIKSDHAATIIQAFIYTKKIWQNINIACYQNQITIEAIEPIAFALSQKITTKEPVLAIYTDHNQTTALLLNQGKAGFSTAIDQPDQITSFLSAVNKEYDLNPVKILYNQSVPDDMLAALKPLNIDLGETNFSLFGQTTDNTLYDDHPASANTEPVPAETVNSAKTRRYSKDKKELEIFLKTAEAGQTPSFWSKHRLKIIVFGFLILAILAFFVVKPAGQNQPPANTTESADEKAKQLQIEETLPADESNDLPAETNQLTADETAIRFDFNIQVLNGTGGPGVAKEAMFYLQELGYKNIDKDNADSFTYVKSEIRLKKEHLALFETIKQDLSEQYEVDPQPITLDDNSEFDLVIVIGETL